MSKWGVVVLRSIDFLEQFGPSTALEVAEGIGATADRLSSTLHRLCVATATMPQRVHVLKWVHSADGQRKYPRPVFEAGPGENAKKPKAMSRTKAAHRKKVSRLYYLHKARRANSFVFNLPLAGNNTRSAQCD